MTWLLAAVHKPSPKSYASYPVVFQCCGSVFLGYCGYQPIANYTDGEWLSPCCTNGNKLGGDVLYWAELPPIPKEAL